MKLGSVNEWEQWAPDMESFERACIEELERRLSRPSTARQMREPAGREFRVVRLDGSYPKTAIVVSFLNLKTGRTEEWHNPLWETKAFRQQDQRMLDPESIAQDIYISLIEP